MENVVKCCQDFLWYFNTRSITCLVSLMIYLFNSKMYNLYNTVRFDSGIIKNKRNKDSKILSLHYIYLIYMFHIIISSILVSLEKSCRHTFYLFPIALNKTPSNLGQIVIISHLGSFDDFCPKFPGNLFVTNHLK